MPAGYRHWPHILWERIDFSGTPRWRVEQPPAGCTVRCWLSGGGAAVRRSDGTDVESEAARVNARLPAHPGMPHLRQPFRPSIFPARREGLRRCSAAHVEGMDRLGYTVLRGQSGPARGG